MALIDCPECKKRISEQAKTCPHCGVKLKIRKTKDGDKSGRGVAIAATSVALIILALVLFWAFGRNLLGKNLQGAYNDSCKGRNGADVNFTCKLSDNGKTLKIDTNTQNGGYFSNYEGSLIVRKVNKYMGFPSVLDDLITGTKASDGYITKEYNGYEITWKSHSSGYGVIITYTKK